MKTFTIQFSGRKAGAIGIFGNFEETVEANNKDEAILKLYDVYEHITILKIV